MPGSDDKYEAVQETDTPYNKLVTVPERKYLMDIAPEIVGNLPDTFEYIDLGPGTEHKEQFIFDAARNQKKQFVYRPIDISDKYLQLSAEYASGQGLNVRPLKTSFEELPEKLGAETNPRFVSIGLTYSNYDPHKVLTLLDTLIGEEGAAFINAQIYERSDIEAIRKIYAEVAPVMVAAKMRLIGLDPEKDVADLEVTDEVKAWYTITNPTPELEAIGVKKGERFLVFQSLRPTLEKLERDIAAVFPDYKLLDKGGSFVGAVLSKRKNKL